MKLYNFCNLKVIATLETSKGGKLQPSTQSNGISFIATFL